MSIEKPEQNQCSYLLKQAINLYYESQIDESLKIINSIQYKDLQFTDQVIYKRYLLLNLIAQGDLNRARDLRSEILSSYSSLAWANDDTLEKYKLDFEEIILIICIWSYHRMFLQGGRAGEDIQNILSAFQRLLQLQNIQLSYQEYLLFSFFLDDEKIQLNLLLRSFQNKQREDLLVYAIVKSQFYAPKKTQFYNQLEEYALQAYQINPKHPLINYILGFYYFYKDNDKSLEYFSKQFELYKKNMYCNTYFMKKLVLDKKYDKFLQIYDQVNLISKNDYRVALSYAEYLIDNHKPAEAYECILNSLKNLSNKKEIELDYFKWFDRQIEILFENDFSIQIYEYAIELGYDFYDNLQKAYLNQGQYERLILLYEKYQQKQEKCSYTESSIYSSVLQAYVKQKNLRKWIELKIKNNENIELFYFYEFEFDYENLEQIFNNHSLYIIDQLNCLIQQYEKDQKQIKRGPGNISQQEKLIRKQYSTYFQCVLDQHLTFLSQCVLVQQLKDIDIYKKHFLLFDLYY
ncbi:hypothetical protein ABPG74_022345 [Tetrahymena malaccensis]